MIAVQLLIALATLVVNAFFVGAEFALISVRRSQIEQYLEGGAKGAQGDRRAKSVLWGLQHVSALMAAAQLGITLCTLILGVVAEPAIAHLLEPAFHAVGVPEGAGHAVSFVIALAAATYLHMLLGEMVPKNIALAEPVRSALLLGPPLVTLARALRPVIFAINAFANGLLKLLRIETKDEVAAAFSDAQLAQIVKDAGEAGLIDDRALERLHDALELGRRPVRDVVLPLEGVVYARVGVTPEQLERLAAESGFSRFPVVDEGRRIVGYLHVKDALDASPRDTAFRLDDMRPIARVREATPLDDVLTAMRGTRTHLAAVLGSDGRLSGLVTMEDVLRELFGQRA
ncbi:hemolysin family protein [Streptomyces sp. NPDC059755]|uniref:hemolysin family protein n=1 Tax=Streptomyces sp. NPDC059755 TaxID=3346934 RepID=UPI003666CDEC